MTTESATAGLRFEFLQNGTVYNRLSAKLHKATGWTISQKIGVADEKNQYRRLFREDYDFHQRQKDLFWDLLESLSAEFTYDERPDNWLFGRVFYLAAERLFEDPANNGSDLGNETRPIFFAESYESSQLREMDGDRRLRTDEG